MKKTASKLRFKKLPYFKPGTLIFSDSGHELTFSDRHYRCLKSTHGKCSANGEKQIQTETLERAFGRYARKFKLEKAVGEQVANDLLKNHLWPLLVDLDEPSDTQEEIMSATTEVMRQDSITKQKVAKSDIKDFEEAYIKAQKVDYPLMLCGFILNFAKVAAHPEKEATLGRNLAILTRKVFLSKDGQIIEIELEPWGWYTMNYISRFVPNYLQALKTNGVKLTNTPNEFLGMPLHEAAIKYGHGYTQEAMGQDMRTMYGLFRFVKDMLVISFKLDPDQMSAALPYMFDRMQNDPAIRIAIQSLGLMGIKPEKLNRGVDKLTA